MLFADRSNQRLLSIIIALGLIFTSMFALFSLAHRSIGSPQDPQPLGTGENHANWIPVMGGLPATGTYYGIVSGDVNNDGQLDFAVARSDGSLHVYVNDGLGNFAEQSSGLPGGGSTFDVVLADFNNDGNLDLAGGGVYLGDGGAGGSMTWSFSSNPGGGWALAVGDVNIDGNMDIVAGTNSGVRVWTGDGGTPVVWTLSSVGLPTSSIFYGVAVGDMNHDGKPDIVCASDGGGIMAFTGNGQTGPASLWTNVTLGSGLPTSGRYMDLAMGDVNHDGNLDVVSTALYSASGVRAWLGNGGSGGTLSWTEASTGLDTSTSNYLGVSLSDVDNDGNLDIFSAHNNMGLRLWYGDGGAGGSLDWTLNTTGLPGGQYVDADAGDFNNDGKADFVVSKDLGGGIEIWQNERQDFVINGYSSISTGLPTSNNWYDIVFGDINNDGNLDLAVSSESNQGVRVFTGDGTGTWSSASTGLPTTGSYTGLRFADVDHNGTLDLIGGSEDGTGVMVWLGDGNGAWTGSVVPGSGYGGGVEVADVNNDGNSDIISCYWMAGANEPVYVWLSDGMGGWGPSTGPAETNGYDDVALGDVNHDGNLDLIATSMAGAVETRLWLGDGTGSLWTLQTPGIPTTGVYLGAAIEDLNHDGNLDAGLASFAGGSVMKVYTSDGGAGGIVNWTDESIGLPAVEGFSGLEFGDLDIDGDFDMVFANKNPGNGILVRTGNGGAGGSMLWLDASQPSLPTTGDYWGIALGDVNNDGKLEIGATRNGAVEVWKLDIGTVINQGPALSGGQVLPPSGNVNDSFTYNVTYSDPNNDPPVPSAFVSINKGGTPYGASPFQMVPQGWVGLPGDYTAGRNYDFVISLTDCGDDYTFAFNASDGITETITSGFMGPSVNCEPESRGPGVQGFPDGSPGIGHITDHTPVLNWTFYDPDIGDNQVAYNATVWDDTMSTLLWFNNASSVSNNDLYNSTGTATSDLFDGNDYWFRIKVFDGSAWSGWTDVMFHMNTPPPIPAEPVNPHFIEVPAGALSLTWTSGGADAEGDTVTYDWQLATDSGFVSVVNSSSTASTSAGVTTAMSTPYYWRVNATDGWETSQYGNATNGYWNFTTLGVINAEPEAMDPSVQGLLQGNPVIMNMTDHTPDIGWTFSDPDIGDTQQEYEVEVWTGPVGTGTNMWDPPAGAGAATSVPYTGLALVDGTTYYFRVRVNDGITWSQWNETMFHMNSPPPTPILATPLSGTVGLVPGSQTIAWNVVADPEGSPISYYWYASADPSFASLDDAGIITTPSASFTTLEATKYYWRVQAHDGYEFGANGTTWNFTTNRPPALDWTGESGYASDGVNPDQGDESTSFEFRISYSDEDNQTGTVKLVILEGTSEVLNATMDEVDSGDFTYSDGKLYTLSEELSAGTYSFRFYAVDSVGVPTITSDGQLVVSEVKGTIRGTVTDASGVLLEDAMVELLRDGQVINTTLTDAFGVFEFPELELGNYTIEVSKSGYVASTETANLNQQLLTLDPIELTETEGEDFPWWFIFVLIIIVIVVLLLLLILWRKKKRDETEEFHEVSESPIDDEAQ